MTTVATASFAGALVEWYDFFLYGTASALVFNKLFFPEFDPTTGTIAALATFGAGYIARPLGGLVFGHYGDRIGRKTLLIITMLMMGIGTFLIGLLPTYHTIGVWAPMVLVALRLVQGFALGGEYAGAALITIEHAPPAKRGFWGSVPQSASPAGVLLGTGVFAAVSAMPEEQFLGWGWRLPFLLSIVMLGIGMFIRLRIDDSPDFAAIKRQGKIARVPLWELLRSYPRNIVLAFGARLAETVSYGVFNVFAISYLEGTIGMSTSSITTGVVIASAIAVIVCPLVGLLSDRIGRTKVYLLGAGFTALFAFPFFALLQTGVTALVWLGLIAGYVLGGTVMFAVQATFFTELFRTGVRYTGLSLAFQASAIVGGFTPLVATSLSAAGSGTPWPVAGFLLTVGVLSFASAAFARTVGEDVAEHQPSPQPQP
ncbi:MAG: MFS transporter [Pseudonocardiaceae bacterium]|nr:MFS transporter [Pseudonocardiaceae bacterium]